MDSHLFLLSLSPNPWREKKNSEKGISGLTGCEGANNRKLIRSVYKHRNMSPEMTITGLRDCSIGWHGPLARQYFCVSVEDARPCRTFVWGLLLPMSNIEVYLRKAPLLETFLLLLQVTGTIIGITKAACLLKCRLLLRKKIWIKLVLNKVNEVLKTYLVIYVVENLEIKLHQFQQLSAELDVRKMQLKLKTN